jgi:hypothetical protein
MKLSETAKEVIALADAIRNYWDTELPKRHPDYPLVHPGEDSGSPPLEEKKLKELLENLPEEMLYKLILIMYLAWGDIGTEDLAGQYEALKERFGKPEWAVSQMRGKASLADDLTDGLAELTRNGIDVDTMTFTSVASGN